MKGYIRLGQGPEMNQSFRTADSVKPQLEHNGRVGG